VGFFETSNNWCVKSNLPWNPAPTLPSINADNAHQNGPADPLEQSHRQGPPESYINRAALTYLNVDASHRCYKVDVPRPKEDLKMAENATKMPVEAEKSAAQWHPFETLRREIDRLFDDFAPPTLPFRRSAFDAEPFWRRELTWRATPAVDIVETEKAYEIVAELPGMDEKNIEVKLVNGSVTIKGEKREEKEEKKKDYYLHERHFGSFERSFRLPDGVDTGKIEASFKKGVLTVTLPKTTEAQTAAKTIAVQASA
jgi:HSP20 family protein